MNTEPLTSATEQVLRSVLDHRAIQLAFQPVVQLHDGLVRGYEALARFDHQHFTSPVHAFAAANAAGLGVDLELLAAQTAFQRLDDMPPGAWLSINLSVEAITTPAVTTLLLEHAHRGITIELTEHTQVTDYHALNQITDTLRTAGILIAVDDAGAGYASLSHVLQLRPDIIKLDITLVRDIDTDPIRTALARALATFARETGAMLIAEGIETHAEHEKLRSLGIELGQGYYMARPGPLPSRHIEPLL
ncbi:EAL domain-containing protein [Amorphoplanes digitatis]|uniref:EAL domain-containing protein (Putative c-di-GMP-specific phosphodiesterase class I) n=1 Tax=Actinoplanes digitatis TaxID=1868 RepID=A0A7W7I592_9ACTN|nr:EAL domain-containing protein [Actinoplanes digitatis]MBB4766704.1 EAL domain-containing protein (putative c-di-GMP-specific phosphodiesterase class I) [Actinoplanes digitatis]